jgi:ppGpp synthetase/RelA/SpoT-type nucleotidyltranferase
MGRVIPVHSRARVDASGDTLLRIHTPRDEREAQELEDALAIINNWRTSHRFPLNSMQVTLRRRAKKIDPKAVVPQRLKRLAAIETKLTLQAGMKLSRMHDIGGCRAILRDVRAVRRLVASYEESTAKNPHKRARFVKKYDYIDDVPKEDGYRGVHLVYQYRSESKEVAVYNGLRIEVQIRSSLQHAFATAVETASIFTEQPIKSIKANLNDSRWRRFFAVMGGALAIREETKRVPGVPEDGIQLATEIRTLAAQLSVETVLSGWGKTVEQLSGSVINAAAYIILLDAETKTTEVVGYTRGELPKTEAEILRLEKQIARKPSQQVVWVKADSIDALRIGYPNFYLDTEAFVEAMKLAIQDLR